MSRNENIAILGVSFGNEDIGHITHSFSIDYDWVIKFNSGENDPHSFYKNGECIIHKVLPCIDFSLKHINGFIGSGVLVDLDQLEIELLAAEKKYPGVSNRIYIDPDAFVIIPKHREKDRSNNGYIACHIEKISGSGTRIKDLLKRKDNDIAKLEKMGVNFKHALELKQTLISKSIIFEGSQGVLLDVNFGTYPFISPFDCTTAGIAASGFSFVMPSKIYGVVKAYSTRLTSGPFPTEIFGQEPELLKKRAGETNNARGICRVGNMDLPAMKYAAEKAGITSFIITRLDVLNGKDKITICHKYDKAPVCQDDFVNVKLKLLKINGWNDPKEYSQIKEFIHSIEYHTETKVSYISCGIDKKDILGL